jgi:hypothetical protein
MFQTLELPEKIRIMLLVMYLCQVHPTFEPVCDSRAEEGNIHRYESSVNG